MLEPVLTKTLLFPDVDRRYIFLALITRCRELLSGSLRCLLSTKQFHELLLTNLQMKMFP